MTLVSDDRFMPYSRSLLERGRQATVG